MPRQRSPWKAKSQHPKGERNSPGVPTIEKFLAKGWNEATIAGGETRSDEIPFDQELENIELFGQVFDADGFKLRVKDRPHARVEEDEDSAVIVLAKVATDDVVFLYRIVPDDDGDDPDEL